MQFNETDETSVLRAMSKATNDLWTVLSHTLPPDSVHHLYAGHGPALASIMECMAAGQFLPNSYVDSGPGWTDERWGQSVTRIRALVDQVNASIKESTQQEGDSMQNPEVADLGSELMDWLNDEDSIVIEIDQDVDLDLIDSRSQLIMCFPDDEVLDTAIGTEALIRTPNGTERVVVVEGMAVLDSENPVAVYLATKGADAGLFLGVSNRAELADELAELFQSREVERFGVVLVVGA